MSHIESDTLLMFVLKTLGESENDAVRRHLSSCEQCKEEERKIAEEISRLSNVDLPLEMGLPPALPRRSRFLITASKIAAVLCVGFLLGYATAEISNPVPPIPVQQRLIPSQIALPSSGYVPAQQVDMRTPPPM